jgi:hypothetical protein
MGALGSEVDDRLGDKGSVRIRRAGRRVGRALPPRCERQSPGPPSPSRADWLASHLSTRRSLCLHANPQATPTAGPV